MKDINVDGKKLARNGKKNPAILWGGWWQLPIDYEYAALLRKLFDINCIARGLSVFENWTIAKRICQSAGFLSSLPYTVGNAFSALMLVIVIKITSLLNHSIGD